MRSALDFQEYPGSMGSTAYLTRGEIEEFEALDQELHELESEDEVSRSSREYLRWIQESLNKILGLRLAADGIMGTQTRSAIRSFQQRHSLMADGIVGAQTERALIAAGASPLPSSGMIQTLGIAPSAVPALVKPKETIPPAYTLYVDIPLQIPLGGAKSMTGIFVPANYRPQSKVDFIVYLHGHKVWENWNPMKPNMSIDSYWRLPPWPLREEVNQSHKNIILVAPTLGPKSQAGRTISAGGFDAFLDQVIGALKQYGPYTWAQTLPSVGNIILACHSGGGLPMRQMAMGNNRYAAQIRECWGFDCTYFQGDDTGWAQWARSRPHARLFIYYIPQSRTEGLSLRLKNQQVSNVVVTGSTPRGRHNYVPIAHWKERIQGAQFLTNK